MQLVRRQESWDPFRELETLSQRMNRVFGLSRWLGDERETMGVMDWAPNCDISENEKSYRICAELPNVKKEDVHVTLEEGVLTIQGERREEKEEKGMRFHRREVSYGNFIRRFNMPPDADDSKVDAAFKDGMLNVVISKTGDKSRKSKEITVH